MNSYMFSKGTGRKSGGGTECPGEEETKRNSGTAAASGEHGEHKEERNK
jgi:hypothetical protein